MACGEISAETLRTWIKERRDFVLLDVRTPEEHKASRIDYEPQQLLPLHLLALHLSQLDKSRVYVVYCRSGNRSKVATTLLCNLGFKAYNLAGGILAWEH